MEIFQSTVVARLIFILGIVNILAVMLIFFSCRCVSSGNLLRKLMKYQAYQRFFGYHCYIWWVLWLSVVIHAILAIGFFGVPF